MIPAPQQTRPLSLHLLQTLAKPPMSSHSSAEHEAWAYPQPRPALLDSTCIYHCVLSVHVSEADIDSMDSGAEEGDLSRSLSFFLGGVGASPLASRQPRYSGPSELPGEKRLSSSSSSSRA